MLIPTRSRSRCQQFDADLVYYNSFAIAVIAASRSPLSNCTLAILK